MTKAFATKAPLLETAAKDSIKNIISVQYDEIFHNDYTVTFDRDMREAQQEAFLRKNADYIDEALFLNALSVDVHTGTQIKSVNMIVADPADPIADFITLKDGDRLLDYPTGGSCIINKNLGENLKLTVGDTLTVYDSDMREIYDLVYDGLGIVDKILGWEREGGEGILTTIYGVLVLLPSWAVLFRRLHDTDRSAWWLLLLLIPIVGWIVILIFNCQSGTPGENRFGPDPKIVA